MQNFNDFHFPIDGDIKCFEGLVKEKKTQAENTKDSFDLRYLSNSLKCEIELHFVQIGLVE